MRDYLGNPRESRALANKISDYWAKKGYRVRVWVEREMEPYKHFVVRSSISLRVPTNDAQLKAAIG